MNLLRVLPFYFFIFCFWNDLRGRGTCLLICTLLTLPHYFLRRWSGCKSRRTLIVADSSSSNSQGTCWTLRCASWHVAALVTSDNSSNLQSICVYDNFLHLISYILAEAAVCMYLCNECAWHGAGLIQLTYLHRITHVLLYVYINFMYTLIYMESLMYLYMYPCMELLMYLYMYQYCTVSRCSTYFM